MCNQTIDFLVIDTLVNHSGESLNFSLLVFVIAFVIMFVLMLAYAPFLRRRREKNTQTDVVDIKSKSISKKKESKPIKNNLKKDKPSNPSNRSYENEGKDPEKIRSKKSQSKTVGATIDVKEEQTPGTNDEIELATTHQGQVKYIGYQPSYQFYQSTPISYPLVLMPKKDSVIKFPRVGKVGNRGYAEPKLYAKLKEVLGNSLQVFNDRSMVININQNPYEPDICLVDEKSGLNLFIDIEIDEPYDGYGRQPTHCKGADVDRDKYFNDRGWIVIRFAEIQVWQQTDACCAYITKVIQSVNENFETPNVLKSIQEVDPTSLWSEEQAKIWEKEKYRESYLGIKSFGQIATTKMLSDMIIDSVEDEVEKQVDKNHGLEENITEQIIDEAIVGGFCISCETNEFTFRTLLKPLKRNGNQLRAFCFIKNTEVDLDTGHLGNPIIRKSAFTAIANQREEINKLVSTATKENHLIRIEYFTPGWTDIYTGEVKEASTKLRTLSDVGLAIDMLEEDRINQYGLDEGYINGYCHYRNENRTFKINRILRIEVLNI